MDFSLSESQRALQETARKFAREVVRPKAAHYDEVAQFPKDVIALGYHMVSDEDLPHLKYYRYKDRGQFEAINRRKSVDSVTHFLPRRKIISDGKDKEH